MTKAWISLEANSNAPGLRLKFRFDNVLIQTMELTDEPQHLYHEFDDVAASHRLEIELSNKLPEHTKIDQYGEIIEDALVQIKKIAISDIELGQVFYGQSLYFHDHNGSSKPVVGQFYEKMGCNGVVRFDFSSPVYSWLIENL
jgi:hypothetical protein